MKSVVDLGPKSALLRGGKSLALPPVDDQSEQQRARWITSLTASAALGRSRTALSALFCLTGVLNALWGSALPATDDRLELGAARLGGLLLVLGAGTLVAMPGAGWLAGRWSGRRLLPVAAPACALALTGPASAPAFGPLACLALGFGLLLGVLNVALTVEAVALEQQYAKPIIAALHGMWGVGAVAGGIVTAAGLRAGLDVRLVMTSGAVVLCLLFLAVCRFLVTCPPASASAGARAVEGDGADVGSGHGFGRLVLLGAVAAAAFLTEGTAVDWAGVHARRVLGADAATGSLVYTVFFVALTGVRFVADTVRARLGPAGMLRLAGGTASAGYCLVLLAPNIGAAGLGCAVTGWALTGAGMATVWPVVTSAVGSARTGTPQQLSMVAAISYSGSLAGPALIGYVAATTSLPTALIIPAALALMVAITGPLAVRAMDPCGDQRS